MKKMPLFEMEASSPQPAQPETLELNDDIRINHGIEALLDVPPQAHEFLEAGAKHLKDRAAVYDKDEDYDGERSMAKTIGMFNMLYGKDLTVEQGWQLMALLKMVRSSQGAFKADNYEDQAAYAALAAETAYVERSK